MTRAWSSRLALVALATTTVLFPMAAPAHPSLDDQLNLLSQQRGAGPCDARIELKRGDLHRARREWGRAADAYARAAACDPNLDEVDYARGLLELDAGSAAGALPFLNRYLDKHPDAPQALLARGRARQRLERSSDAARDFALALTLLPDPQPDHYLECARAELAAGRTSDAINRLDAGMQRLGPVPALERMAVDVEVEQRRYDAALQRIDTTIARGVDREEWLVRRADILEAAGRRAEAREAYEAALSALAARPNNRRQLPALQQLEDRARDGVKRLAAAPAR